MFNRIGAKEHARFVMRDDLSACVGAYMFSVLLALVPFGAPAGTIGLWRYNLDVVRGGKPRASKTLRGFDSFSRALALSLWNILYRFLWILPGYALMLIGTLISLGGLSAQRIAASFLGYGSGSMVVMVILSIIAALWMVFISIYKQAQYMFSFAILADHPQLTAKQCLDASVELSTPHVGNIIVTMLSFLGWTILSVFTSGILGILYVFPYMNLTWADIYCQITPRERWGNAGNDPGSRESYEPGGYVSPPTPLTPPAPPPPPVRPVTPAGSIRGVAGYYTGYKFPLGDGEQLGIGRDSKQAQIVFADSEDSKKISRLHCTVSFSEARGVYTVTDRSSNGTFRADGSPLPPNTPVELPRGTTIYLGNPNNSFRLE